MLFSGLRLGPYEIVELLGRGGMGEVYRARDTALRRQVAIKILPAALARDPDRRARFEREAQTLALLQHPHVASIYGLESAGDLRGLVLELVEGDTLSERIRRGLHLDESLSFARQIAEALEAAHDRGIVHRDLKPANIKITHDGVVKVLDFGIAKAIDGWPEAPFGDSPTVTAVTRPGQLLGTPAYMSPEQARGHFVDKRTDLWALGCVLYEMLTGRSAFGRETATDTLAAVLERDPDWRALPTATPPMIRLLLRRCLEKDRKQRLDSAAAARLEIADALAGARRDDVPARARRRWGALAVAAATGAAMAGVLMWSLRSAPAGDAGTPMQFTIVPPSSQLIAVPGFRRSIVTAPDGRSVAYVSGSGSQFGPIVVRRFDQLEGRLVPGVGPAADVTFSPDSRWIAFVDEQNTIKRVSVDGGAPVEIVRNEAVTGSLAWGDDDAIMFTTLEPSTGLLRLSANGGDVEVLTRPDGLNGEAAHTAPSHVARGRGVLFAIVRSGGVQDVAVLDLRTRRYRRLVRGGMPQYVEMLDGSSRRREFVVFAVDGRVRAAPFDGDRLELTGDPVTLADQVYVTGNGRANYSISQSGTLVYMPAAATAARSLVWVDRAGSKTPVRDAPHLQYDMPRLSPDGSIAALIVGGRERRVAAWDFKAGRLTQVTTGPGIENTPVWMPNGRDLLFGSSRGGNVFNLHRQTADGSGVASRLSSSDSQQFVMDVVRDGSQALIIELGGSGPSLVLLSTSAAGGRAQVLGADTQHARLSPDGRFVAYDSMETGRREVYVRPFPDAMAARWQVSHDGGASPTWSRDGKELFYLDPSDVMMAARITSGRTTFGVDPPRRLFDASFARAGGPPGFDVTADGRFLMPAPVNGPAASTSSTLVVKTRALDVVR